MAYKFVDEVPVETKPKYKLVNIEDTSASDTLKDIPEYLRRAGSYASEGIANLGDMFLNLPTNVQNLAKAGVGTAMTASGRPDLAPNLTPNPNLIRKGFEKAGFIDPSVTPQGPLEEIARGVTQAGVAGMAAPAGSVPQMAGNVGAAILSELAGQGTEKATGSPMAGMAARMLAVPAVAGAANYAQAKSATTKAINAPKDKVLIEARKLGYKVPRSDTSNTSFMENRAEGIAGKAALKQGATANNQVITNEVIRKELGYANNEPISLQSLNQKRTQASWPYDRIRSVSSRAKVLLDQEVRANNQANRYWKQYDTDQNVLTEDKARAFQNKADMLAKSIRKELQRRLPQSEASTLYKDWKDARTYVAKTYDVERALNITTGDVEAPILARINDKKGGVFTGGLKTVADFATAFPKFATPGVTNPAPGVGKMEMMSAGGFGGMGWGLSGDPFVGALTAGTVLATPPAVRAFLLSGGHQSSINPKYPLARIPPQEDALLRSLLLIGAGQE